MGQTAIASGVVSTRASNANRRGRRHGTRPSEASNDSFFSPVNVATAPRECRGRAERRYVRRGPPPQYPFYYVTHVVVIPPQIDAGGNVVRPGAKRKICDDCLNNEILRHKIDWERKEAEDGRVRTDAEVLADAPADADPSVSGAAIAALGAAVVRDADGQACGLELAEGALLPETDAALLLEIKAGVLAGDDVSAYRQVVERYKRAAGATRMVPITV
jgi:hypothetical protein